MISIVCKTSKNAHTDPLCKSLGLLKFDEIYGYCILLFYFVMLLINCQNL